MKISEIQEVWDKDTKIDMGCLETESLNIPYLHNKYYKILLDEKSQQIKLNEEYKALFLLRKEYYQGNIDSNVLKAKGWKPFNLIISKEDIQLYLSSDKVLRDLRIGLELQKEKIKYLESIIDMICKRNFQISGAINFLKFKNGLS